MKFFVDQDLALYTMIVRKKFELKGFPVKEGKLANSNTLWEGMKSPQTWTSFSVLWTKRGSRPGLRGVNTHLMKFVLHSEMRHPLLNLLPVDIM